MLRKIGLACLCIVMAAQAFAEIKVEDSRGMHTLPATPVRVAALNWDIAEQVLELGVTPVAMPDISGYNEWVVTPEAPAAVEDIGTRVEPNLERLAQLNPDVIMIASPQQDLLPRLQKIAPVLYYQTFSAEHDNAEAAIENFRKIAQVLDKQAVAEEKLANMQLQLDDLKQQLITAYGNELPKVAAFRFASTTSIYLYGENAITQYALKQLGIEPALPQPKSQWGVTQKRITDLSQLSHGEVALYFQPFEQEEKLQSSVLWTAMPFVKTGRVASVDPVWSYGGAMSILYNAQAVTKALLSIAPTITTQD